MRLLAKDLRDSILQSAIQGKLVEQRAEEGTAEELYQQIQEEKQRLIVEKKIKKEKPLPEITEDEKPFEIPENWKWVRLGEIGSTHIGLTYNPKNVSEKGIIVLRSSNIQNQQIDYQDIVRVDMDVPEKKMCHMGDILICARNGSKRLVGKAALIDREGMSFGAFMAIYRSKCNAYILHVINSVYFRNFLLGDTGTTTINQITQDMLKNTLIPLPPLAEQKRIVEKIEQILPHIDQYEKMEKDLEKLEKEFPEDMKNSLLQAAMQGKLTEQLESDGSVDDLIEQIKVERQKLEAEGKIKKSRKTKKSQQNDNFVELSKKEYPFDIPNNWKFYELKSVTITNGGYAFKSTNYSQNGIRVIRISDFNNNGLLFGDIVRYPYSNELLPFKIKENDILMCMTGGTVGKCCMITSCNEDMATNQRVANISSICVNPKFLYLAIKSPYIQKIIQNNKTSTNDNISMDLILSFPIPLPPLEEQKRIVSILDKLLPLCEVL